MSKTGWYIPSIGKYIFYNKVTGITVEGGLVPNYNYWFKIIHKHGLNPPGALTEFKSDSGHYVYQNPTSKDIFIFNEKAEIIKKFKGIARVRALMYKKSKPKSVTPSAPPKPKSVKVPKNLQNTGLKSANGKNVHKNINGKLYVLKNGKWTQQFKGKKALAVPAPVVKPGPSHIPTNSKFQKLGLLLKAIAKKKATLKSKQTVNNYQEWTKNQNKGLAYIKRANTLRFGYTSVRGMGHEFSSSWKLNLMKPLFRNEWSSFGITYDQAYFASQLTFSYYPLKNFESVGMKNIIDTEWLRRQNKFVRTLTSREIFLMIGFSHNGDTWAHAYLDGRFDLNAFRNSLKNLGNNYFAFFFQARDFYGMASSDVTEDYNKVLARTLAETDPKNIKSIAEMFISELNALILRAPATTTPFTVFRGVKDDTYMSGVKDKQYVLNRFASTTVNGMKALEFGRKPGQICHTLQRILILPGTKCLCLFGMTAHEDELEILLPRGTVYSIRKTEKDAKQYKLSLSSGQPMQGNIDKTNNLVDIIVLGMSKKYTPARVAPAKSKTPNAPTDPNVAKAQRIINGIGVPFKTKVKVLSKLGEGGYGTVFKGLSGGRNAAIKFQKQTENVEVESMAMNHLENKGIAPKRYATRYKISQKNKNFANLVPKGLNKGNKGAVTVQQFINGKGLQLTGAPLNSALKQKIANQINKMHKAGVIHGNLHRNNIIINKNGKPWIIDFGKAIVKNNGGWRSTVAANEYIKGLGKGFVEKYGKKFYYSNNAKTRSHQPNGNFLKRLT